MQKISEFTSIKKGISIKQAIEIMNQSRYKILFVVDNNDALVGTVTDGDLRRYLQSGKINLRDDITVLYNRNPRFNWFYELPEKQTQLTSMKINYLPILDNQKRILYVLRFDINFQEKSSIKNKVVIMAGGKGTRLLPLTRVIPKPLVPYKDKTIIEKIMEQFITCGFEKFILTINYKGEMIKNYFERLIIK